MTTPPLPGTTEVVVAVPAPGQGVGYWAGSSSAALDEDGTFVIAYRVRTGEHGRGAFRIYYEARLPDESHELRTELIPAVARGMHSH